MGSHLEEKLGIEMANSNKNSKIQQITRPRPTIQKKLADSENIRV